MNFERSRKSLSARVTSQAKLRGDNDDPSFQVRVEALSTSRKILFGFFIFLKLGR